MKMMGKKERKRDERMRDERKRDERMRDERKRDLRDARKREREIVTSYLGATRFTACIRENFCIKL